MFAVRQARQFDRAAVVATVVEAFRDDPAWEFMHAPDYDLVAPLLAGALFDLRVDAGDVWVVDDCWSVAMWEPPGGNSFSSGVADDVWRHYREVSGEAAWLRLAEYDRAVDAVRPSTPYWYLGVLATRPERQGRGQARAILTPVVELADRDRLDCCLETSKPSNKPLYARLGFMPEADIEVSGGPPTWWLRRPPA